MKRLIALALAAGVAISIGALAQTSNPLPGYVWTYFGPTFGGGWGPSPNLQGAGATLMFPSTSWTNNAASTIAWTIVPPLGHAYSCATTNSQCFQETLNTAFAYGDSLELRCPGELQSGPQTQYIASTININTRPLVQRSVRSYGCNITFANTVHGFDLRVNTMLDGATFYWDGQIVDTKDNLVDGEAPVVIGPNECPPLEGCGSTVIEDSEIFISAVVTGITNITPGYSGQGGSLVEFDLTGGSINANTIEIGELNGCGPCSVAGARASFGVTAFNAGGGKGLIFNKIHVKRVHNVRNGLQIGAADGQEPLYSRNTVELNYCNLVNPDGTTGGCIVDFGYFNKHLVHYADNAAGPYASVVNFQSTNNQSKAEVLNAIGFTNAFPIVDAGVGNSYSYNGNVLQEFKGSTATLTSGTQYNYGPILSTAGQAAPAVGTNPTNSEGRLTFAGGTGTATINFGKPFGVASGSAWLRTPWCDMSPTSGFFWTLTGISTTSATFTPSGSVVGGSISRYVCSGQQ